MSIPLLGVLLGAFWAAIGPVCFVFACSDGKKPWRDLLLAVLCGPLVWGFLLVLIREYWKQQSDRSRP